MFSSKEAPFFRFAQPISLPALDEEYARYLLEKMAATCKRSANQKLQAEALRCFQQLHRDPLYYRRLIESLPLRSDWDLAAALEDLRRDKVPGMEGFTARLEELKPLDHELLLLIRKGSTGQGSTGQGSTGPYSQESLAILGAVLGQPPKASEVQTALKRLERRGFLLRQERDWVLEDPLFGDWLAGFPES